ncbi:urea ABC transporter permease subunit UrtB [Cerasicoccus fimbriatus]|uniref:urea ABC transporter permease subunit UrtB n=1 Tax=Cerasicoccus fimbriatus TaxID=3014554 RepID=UPI0022B3ABD0|nr:urea ABC transporter permease subunit UrtB [Cerasicoccus sp. TK19100]
MRYSSPIILRFIALATCLLGMTSVNADESEARQILAEAMLSSGDDQMTLVESLVETGEPKIVDTYLEAWKRGDVYVYEAKDGSVIPLYIPEEDGVSGPRPATVVATGEIFVNRMGEPEMLDPTTLDSARPSRKTRKAFTRVIDLVALSSQDPIMRADAALKLGLKQDADYLPVLLEMQQKETDDKVNEAVAEGIAVSQLALGSKEERLAAIQTLQDMNSIAGMTALENFKFNLKDGVAGVEFTESEMAVLDSAMQSIESYIKVVDFIGTCFRGLSLGAVLVIVALGLAITFGLMGVINMAHGEMIAVGAYSAYISQQMFTSMFASTNLAYETYFFFAIPFSFLIAALCGLVLERSVIQFLYKRPLESLLATWGVSLILQQGFRLVFGAANRQVNSPSWLLGNIEIFDITFGYNRLFVIGFAALIVFGTWLLMTKTSLGLAVRAVMQDPMMASAMGIRIERVRMMTFAFGSGLAGLAGVFLSQIGSVGSNLGQSYIVDSFMVVVVGGVGNIFGTVISALGIGVTDQALQPAFGPVMGRITVLVIIIIFLQWKPGGLFPSNSRSLD